MTDDDLLALCVWDEAAGEPYEGKVAVARVLLNRMAARFESDGTVAGTVLAKDQFSGFWFAMSAGKYTRVCWTPEEAHARAESYLWMATRQAIWADCARAAADAAKGVAFAGGPEWAKLAAQPRALMYANMSICSPGWATADKLVARIFHHTFYRA